MKIKISLLLLAILSLLAIFYIVYNYDNAQEVPISNRLGEDYNSEWAFSAIRNEGYDANKLRTVNIAIIDGNSPAHPDNGSSNMKHSSLMKTIIQRVAPNCEITTYNMENEKGKVTYKKMAECIRRAAADKNLVINISYGAVKGNDKVKKAIYDVTNNQNIAVVCSSGNNGKNKLLIPARYEGTISVMARTIDNVDLPSSNFSLAKKSISAPGFHIKVSDNYYSGTSVAAAFITGAISVLKGLNPELKNKELLKVFDSSCIYGSERSYGLIQIDKAIKYMRNNLMVDD